VVVDFENSVAEEHALDFVRGLAGDRRARQRLPDPTSFLMDGDLVVRCAGGESIMRLPWFDDDLFVGRQLPDISEMPADIRSRAVEHYLAALHGRRGSFAFVSYGHAYRVDALPVRRQDGRIAAVLGVATPAHGLPAAAVAYERTAQRLERSAAQAEQRAERHRTAGRRSREEAERARAGQSRAAAARARAHAQHLRAGAAAPATPVITPRETDVLTLASHGMTSKEIAEQLVLSPGTVRTHFENVYLKLGVSDKAAAVAAALRYGLIE
jgi:DNA-binding CsgD family transcriptional regulator